MLVEIESFVNWLRRRNPQARTWRDYSYDLKQFAAAVGDRPPAAVTFHDLDRFVALQAGRGFKPATINRCLAAVAALYTFLSDDDPHLVCPVLPHRHGLREPQHLPRPVQDEDLRKFFAGVDDARDRAMFVLMVRCGLRISEVAGLQLADLYLYEGHPRLVIHGKGSKERSVYLSPQAERAARAYLAERPRAASDFVFLSYRGDGMSTTAIHNRIRAAGKRAGVKVSPHRLRHTCGRPFGRLVNTSKDVARWQERAFSPWRPGEPRRSGLVSVQGTRASCEGKATPQKANVQKGWEGLAG